MQWTSKMELLATTDDAENLPFPTHPHLPPASLETGSLSSGRAVGVQLPEISGVEHFAAHPVPQPLQASLQIIVPSVAADMATMRTASVERGLPVSGVGHLLPKSTMGTVVSGGHEQFVEVTLCGLANQVHSSIAIVLACMEEAADLHAGAHSRLGLAMPVQQSVFELLVAGRGARLKELCREAGGPLRMDLEDGKVDYDGHGLLLMAGLSGPLRVALIRLWQLSQEVSDAASRGGSGVGQRLPVNGLPMALNHNAAAALPSQPMGAVDEHLLLWLGSLDGGRGDLLVYHQRLGELIEDTSELRVVARGPQGEVPNPQFFEDLGVQREDHKQMFRRWFEAQFVQQSFL